MNTSYITVTPSGAYQAVSNILPDIARKSLLHLMRSKEAIPFDMEYLCELTSIPSVDVAKAILLQLQDLHLVQIENNLTTLPKTPFDILLQGLIQELSSSNKAMLINEEGVIISQSGFSPNIAKELSSVGVSVLNFQSQHNDFFTKTLGQKQNAWANVNQFGDSQISFWTINLRMQTNLLLIISDIPRFNRLAFRNFIWTLCVHMLK